MTSFDSSLWKIWNLKINILWLHIKLTVAGKKNYVNRFKRGGLRTSWGIFDFFHFFFPICACLYGQRGLSPGTTLLGREAGGRLNSSIQISTKLSEIIYVNRHGGRQAALKGLLILISRRLGESFSTAGLWSFTLEWPGEQPGACSWIWVTELVLTFSEQ